MERRREILSLILPPYLPSTLFFFSFQLCLSLIVAESWFKFQICLGLCLSKLFLDFALFFSYVDLYIYSILLCYF